VWLSKFAMAMSVVPSEGKQNLRVPAMEGRSAFMRTCRARIVVWGRILRVSGILGWKIPTIEKEEWLGNGAPRPLALRARVVAVRRAIGAT
jgi:hypothetical protein